MYIQYDGGIEDDIITEIVEKVLEDMGFSRIKKKSAGIFF